MKGFIYTSVYLHIDTKEKKNMQEEIITGPQQSLDAPSSPHGPTWLNSSSTSS